MSRMFNIFHVSLLRRCKDGNRRSAPPPAVFDAGEVECEIDNILAHCDTKHLVAGHTVCNEKACLQRDANGRLLASKTSY